MLEYDPKTNLQHYPLPMQRFGLNPFGEPLYRIVFTASRRNLAADPMQSDGFQWVPTYPAVKTHWILERWHSAFEYCRMTKTQWDRELLEVEGPYPSRGEYSLAWEFNLGVDADGLDKIVGLIEAGRQRSTGEIRAAHVAEYAQEDRDTRSAAQDEIRDSFRAFGSRPFAAAGGGRGTKTVDFLRTAEECGLPVPGAMPSTQRIGNRRTVDVRDIQVRNSLISGAI